MKKTVGKQVGSHARWSDEENRTYGPFRWTMTDCIRRLNTIARKFRFGCLFFIFVGLLKNTCLRAIFFSGRKVSSL